MGWGAGGGAGERMAIELLSMRTDRKATWRNRRRLPPSRGAARREEGASRASLLSQIHGREPLLHRRRLPPACGGAVFPGVPQALPRRTGGLRSDWLPRGAISVPEHNPHRGLLHAPLGTQPATRKGPDGDATSSLSAHRPMLNRLSHSDQGRPYVF